jgi:hypothetical protein
MYYYLFRIFYCLGDDLMHYPHNLGVKIFFITSHLYVVLIVQ